jgi:hypothetical protein
MDPILHRRGIEPNYWLGALRANLGRAGLLVATPGLP